MAASCTPHAGFKGPVPHEDHSIWQTIYITALPALSMAVGSAAISLGAPSETLQVRLQHLSAGLLIGACLADIFPILKARLYYTPLDGGAPDVVNWYSLLAAALGFAGALFVMYGIKALGLEEDDGASVTDIIRQRSSSFSSPVKVGVSELASSVGTADPHQPLLRPLTGPEGAVVGQEADNLRINLSRLKSYVTALKELVDQTQVDREAVDEQVHALDFMIDQIRRLVRGAEPIDSHNAARMRDHVVELQQDIETLLGMNLDECGPLDKQLRVAAATLRHIHSHTERGGFRRWAVRRWETPHRGDDRAQGEEATIAAVHSPLPMGLIIAVITDSVVDGMLIGLAASVASESGWLMAIATAIEMGFLGYSFACSISKSGSCLVTTSVLAMPPVCMLCAACIASIGAGYVENSPAFVGLVAFALVALLFLVVDELLAEAHENEESHDWKVSVWLYVGLLISIALDVIL